MPTIESLGLDAMPLDDQLKFVGAIWSHIAATESGSLLTDGQRAEPRRRVAEDDADPDGGTPWDEVTADARRRLGSTPTPR